MRRSLAKIYGKTSLNASRRRRRKDGSVSAAIQPESLEPRLLLSGTNGHSGAISHHAAVMNLVSDANVTHTATKTGKWSDPAVWADGSIPGTDANVVVARNVKVTIAGDLSGEAISTIRVDGTLKFSRAVDSHLLVETLVVNNSGRLEIGTAAKPIPAKTNIRITFADAGKLNPNKDPLRIGRGLIAAGAVSVVGSTTTSHVELRKTADRAEKVLYLSETPTRWKKGDSIVVPGLDPLVNQDEEFVIESVNETSVTLSGRLRYSHRPPLSDLRFSVANLSRNVVFESENARVESRRGHVMFMHNNSVRVENAAFNGLGRTDKRTPIEDAQFAHDGSLVDGTGLNQRGRYAVHFHQGGTTGQAALFRGNAIVDSPGWGLVNHSSKVNVVNNVVYHVGGSSFVTEAGDETGSFKNNIAIRSTGSGDGLMERTDQQDFGHRGNGFWFQGSGVEVSDNIATGHANVGFIYFIQGKLKDDGTRTEFRTENLKDESLDNGKETIDPRRVPIPVFRDNTAFAVGDGFQSWFHLQPRTAPTSLKSRVPTPGQTVIDRLTVWNTRRRAVHLPYTNGMTFKDAVLIGDLSNPMREAIGRNDNTENIQYINSRIEGWAQGIDVPARGRNRILGGTFRNVVNIKATMGQDAEAYGLTVDNGPDGRPITFVRLRSRHLRGRMQQNIKFDYDRTLNHNNLNSLFVPTTIRVNAPGYRNQQVFFKQQSPDFVPLPNEGPNVPGEIAGQTNAQLHRRFGLATGGFVVPDNARFDESSGVYLADPVDMPTPIRLQSDLYPVNGQDYHLKYQVESKTTLEDKPTTFKEGWNLLTRTIRGQKRSILVFADKTPPRFKLQPITPRSLNPSDRNATIYVVGQIMDTSLGRRTYKRPFNLSDFDVKTDGNGDDYLKIRFNVYDRAGNSRNVKFRIELDSETLPLHELYRNDLDERSIPELLLDE